MSQYGRLQDLVWDVLEEYGISPTWIPPGREKNMAESISSMLTDVASKEWISTGRMLERHEIMKMLKEREDENHRPN